MTCRIDHIAIAASSLDAGSDWVFRQLCVRPQPGGHHPRMGTHNRLLRLGEAMYLEVIAIDPAAPRPPRPRWFGLDERPADAAPALACWVARTDALPRALADAPEALGVAEPMSRGALQWLISVPPDGGLPLGGAAPVLIEWQTPAHPVVALKDQGLRLVELVLAHPEPARLRTLLQTLDVAEPAVAITVQHADRCALAARIQTPGGIRRIGAPGLAGNW